MTISNITNPFSTSGSGMVFEQLVGASYLVSLLAHEIPRGLNRGICAEVRFQQRWSGCLLDDIVVIANDGSEERKLALQIKHNLLFSDASSNREFARVIGECWGTFTGSKGWKFNQETDRLGIGVGLRQNKVDAHFKPMLEWARTSRDSAEFMDKISSPVFSSKEKQKYLLVIRNLLTKAKGSNVTDHEMWMFLKCLVVLNFDLENAGSSDTTYCWNRLLDQLKKRDATQARLLFDALVSIVEDCARSAGSINAQMLRAKIPNSISLKDAPNCTSDLAHLRKHSDVVLDSIRDTIGLRVRLPRSEKIDQLEVNIKENEIVVISGEPMVGKSVLLKLLANRLRSEGELIALSVERFQGTSLVGFLKSINVENDISAILSSIGSAPFRCILIDGLERAVDEDKRRILNDLIIAVRHYNEFTSTTGGHKDNFWRIVCTCRLLETRNLLLHLETRKSLADNTLRVIEIGTLNSEEIVEVTNQFPNLKSLVSRDYLKEILSRPLVLDILTLPSISLLPECVPSELSESWLADWYWKEVVRLADGANRGRGDPDQREQLLIHLAMHSLAGNPLDSSGYQADAETVSGLVSDRLLIKEGNRLRFAHDALEDWTLAVILRQHQNEISAFLLQMGDPLCMIRPFRLYISRLLEIERTPTAWLNLLAALEKESALSPRWHQIALTAPLFSPMLIEILPIIEPCLLGDNGVLLSNFLKAVRTVCVQPSPLFYSVLGDLPQDELEKYLAYWTVPVTKQWAPIIQLMLQNPEVIKQQVLDEFSYLAEKWMKNAPEGDQLFRKEIATISLAILNDGLLEDYEDQPKNRYILSALYAADCLPKEVSAFVLNKSIRNRENKEYGFEELILKEGWIPICKHLPETALKVLEEILCKKIEPDQFENHISFFDLGIKHNMWVPPTYFDGPFLGFLRFHEANGLALIQRMVNHATQFWKKREKLEWNRTPISQTVKLDRGTIEVWGDEHVYQWFRYPSVAPNAITCALMALEYWMNEQLKKGIDSKQLFENVLQNTESVALLGVCSAVALANSEICREVIVPILENPAFWIMDVYRLVQDLTAEGTINAFSTYFSFGTAQGKANYRILLELAKQPHRKLDIRSFVLPIILLGPDQVRDRVQKALRAFPKNPPVFFEDEKENKALIQERKKDCEIWAAQAEIENYEKIELEGQIGIQFKLPHNLEEEQKEKLRLTQERNKLYAFLYWSMDLLDNDRVGQAFSLDSGIKYTQELVCDDDPTYQPASFLEYSEQRAQAIAAFAASMVVRKWQWIKENGHVPWFREQLLVAAKRPEPPSSHDDQISRYPIGYRRSAARALFILLKENPKDKEVRRAILDLSLHVNDEVRIFLFSGLRTLWLTDSKTIWKCIDNGLRISRSKNIRKPIRACLPTEVNTNSLMSVLYCLPTGFEVDQIARANRLVDFLEDLLIFTLNAYDFYQKNDSRYNAWDHNDWNHILFPIVASFGLRLPQHIVESKFYNHIMKNWEKTPAMMKTFLRSLLSIGCQPELEDRLAELWPRIGENILSSQEHKNIKYCDENRDIIGLLIFADPAGIITWRVQDWKPLKKLIPFINRWCETLGYNSVHFSSLVRFLKTIGFSLFPEFGISWLYDCISKLDNKEETLSKISYTLSELLCDAWSKNATLIKQNAENMRHFIFIVDTLAKLGDPSSLRLQAKLQAP